MCIVINSIKDGRQIKQGEFCCFTLINVKCNVIVHFEESSFCRMKFNRNFSIIYESIFWKGSLLGTGFIYAFLKSYVN